MLVSPFPLSAGYHGVRFEVANLPREYYPALPMCPRFSLDSASEFFEQVCRSSDHPTARFWTEYWLRTGHARRLYRMIERMDPMVNAGTSIVDIGGFGELLLLLWKFLGVTSLRGVSLEGDLVAYGNGKLLQADDPAVECHIPIDQCNLERDRLKYPCDSVDMVTCFEVLEHLRVDPIFMLIEINRILRPGGILFLSTPNGSSWDTFARVADFDAPLTFSSYFADGSGIGHCKEYSVGEFRRIVETSGFAIDRLETLDNDECSRPLREKYSGLANFVEEQEWWQGDLRRQTQLVIARKSGKPSMRMYQPLYSENFFYVDNDGKSLETEPIQVDDPYAEITKLREYVSRLSVEVETRTRWAQSLEDTIAELRASREALEKEVDARGEWAKNQDEEILSLRREIRRLEGGMDSRGEGRQRVDSENSTLRGEFSRIQRTAEEWRDRAIEHRDRAEKMRELYEDRQRQLDALILRLDELSFLFRKVVRALLRKAGIPTRG